MRKRRASPKSAPNLCNLYISVKIYKEAIQYVVNKEKNKKSEINPKPI